MRKRSGARAGGTRWVRVRAADCSRLPADGALAGRSSAGDRSSLQVYTKAGRNAPAAAPAVPPILTLPSRTRLKRRPAQPSAVAKRALQSSFDSVGLMASTKSGYAYRGYYYMYGAQVQLGTPAAAVVVDIDTGSPPPGRPGIFLNVAATARLISSRTTPTSCRHRLPCRATLLAATIRCCWTIRIVRSSPHLQAHAARATSAGVVRVVRERASTTMATSTAAASVS